MKCPVCHVYDVDPDSKEGWCTKCTGVFAHKSGITPPPYLVLIQKQTDYLFSCEQAVLFAQTQADEYEGTPLHHATLMLLVMAIANREQAQKDLAALKGERQSRSIDPMYCTVKQGSRLVSMYVRCSKALLNRISKSERLIHRKRPKR